MIVLPNSFERYLSSLRIWVSLSVIKYGLHPQHMKKLKKIHLAEAFHNKETTQSVDIAKLCKNYLYSAKALKPTLDFGVFANGNHKINKKLLTALLLTVTRYANLCIIHTTKNHIIIKTENAPANLSPFIDALGGYSLIDIITNKALIVIPSPITNTPSVYIESEWELLFDKFSVFNVFFERINFD